MKIALTPAAVLSAVILVAGASSASAENWHAGDPSGDVSANTYAPEPAPCGTWTESVAVDDTITDIVAVAARHRKNVVELRAEFRDLKGQAQQFVWFEIETEKKAFEVHVDRYKTGGKVKADLMPAAPPPSNVSECGTVAIFQAVRPCVGLVADISMKDDLVSVTVPRACLGEPRWVRVGVKSVSFLDDIDEVRHDHWAPDGTDGSRFTGPFGPRLRSG